jgi:dienelactone hydrolase
VDNAQVQQFAGKGYLSEEQFSIRTTPQTWVVAGQTMDLLLSVPVRSGRYPIVIYLPGLGENRMAGEIWRNAWAQAGYAVLSVQPLGRDSVAWQSQEARNDGFKPLVRERFSAAVMDERQANLRALLTEFQKRSRSGDELLANIDPAKVAVVGYDLGAYTALVAAGERTGSGKLPARKNESPFRAVIALSPYADFNGPAFEQRYGDIKIPVLSVTGDGDTDVYGLGISSRLRSAPFQFMPPGDKFLLLLESANHDLFAGNAQRAERSEQGDSASTKGNRRERGRRGQSTDGMADDLQGIGRGVGTARAMGQSAVTSVTTAFLDTYLKGDGISREWLSRDARRWLKNIGSLTVK